MANVGLPSCDNCATFARPLPAMVDLFFAQVRLGFLVSVVVFQAPLASEKIGILAVDLVLSRQFRRCFQPTLDIGADQAVNLLAGEIEAPHAPPSSSASLS